MKTSVKVFVLLSLVRVPLVFASGGPENERRIECKGNNHLIVLRLADAYSSELQGSALIYDNASNRGKMLTSMDACFESKGLAIKVPVAVDKAASPLLICGSVNAKQSQVGKSIALEANSNGYRALYFKLNGKSFARLEKIESGATTAMNVFGSDLACSE